jgi:hypothetical protein
MFTEISCVLDAHGNHSLSSINILLFPRSFGLRGRESSSELDFTYACMPFQFKLIPFSYTGL